VDSFEAANQTRKGLSDLRNAFLLYFVSGILGFVPVIGIIGGLVNFIGLILLIIGWRALGRSSLREKWSYKSTGSWLVYVIIIIIVVGIIGIFVVATSAITIFTSNPNLFRTNSSSTNATAILQSSAFRQAFSGVLEEVFALIAVLEIIWFSVWIKMLLSLRKLGSELSERRITTGANLYLVQIAFAVSTGLTLVFFLGQFLQTGLVSPSPPPGFGQGNFALAPYSYLALGGYWSLLFVVTIVGNIVQIIGSYFVYSGLGTATRTMQPATIPLPPPFPTQSPAPGQNSFCPQCGGPINDANNFCPYCGTKLKT
jgi:hypothetical protein